MSQWVITDSQNNIQDLPGDILTVDFESVPAGRCLIYNVSYEPGLMGLTVGNNLDVSLTGEYSISNAMEVLKGTPNGGMITGGPYDFCVGNGQIDAIPVGDIQLVGNTASNTDWIITDAGGVNIIAIVNNPSDFDFDSTGDGSNLIWHLSSEGTIGNLVPGELIANLSGCFGLSNSITITKTSLSGGTLTGGPFYFCVNDGEPDFMPAGSVTVSGNTGTANQWIVTDVGGTTILDLPTNLIQNR